MYICVNGSQIAGVKLDFVLPFFFFLHHNGTFVFHYFCAIYSQNGPSAFCSKGNELHVVMLKSVSDTNKSAGTDKKMFVWLMACVCACVSE